MPSKRLPAVSEVDVHELTLPKLTTPLHLLLVLACFILSLASPSQSVAQQAPELTITTQQDSVFLNWNRPAGQRRWAVLRSQNPMMRPSDTLIVTADTTFVDARGASFNGKHRFYQVLPWVPSLPQPGEPIEAFGFETPPFTSYPGEDSDPDVELIERPNVPGNEMCLRISGDSWKVLDIEPRPLSSSTVWSLEALCVQPGAYQMIGFGDGTDEMWYVLWGRHAPNTDSLITTFQGYFPTETWQTFHLPIGEDWHGRFGTHPEIDRVYLVNDLYSYPEPGEWMVDNLDDATDVMPDPPGSAFDWTLTPRPELDSLDVQFTNLTLDSDSDELEFLWFFGDGTHSTEEHPVHRYPSGGEWPVTLRVTDGSLYWDYHSRVVEDYPVSLLPEPFRITCVGDMILARRLITDYINPFGPGSVFDHVRDQLTDADITIGNLESPLAYSDNEHPTKTIIFKGYPSYAEGLPTAGFDLVTLANNHILDYMEEGMLETMEAVEEQGILWIGAGMNDILARRPAFLNREGQVIAVSGYSNRDGHYNNYQPFLDAGRDRPGFAPWNRSSIEATIPAMSENADLVMVQVHCGSEYSLIPMDGDKRNIQYVDEILPDDPNVIFNMIPDSGEVALRHYAVEQGADLVICHHPHIIQGLEVYQDKLIAHSLGNFVFDLTYNECLPSMILNIDVDQEGVTGADVVPIWIEDYLPRVATGGLARSILDYLSHYSRLLDTHFIRYPGEEIGHVIFDTTYARSSESNERTLPLLPDIGSRITRPVKIEGDGYLTELEIEEGMQGMVIRYGRDMLHWGNMEDEGADAWNLNSDNETWSDVGRDDSRCIQISIPGGTPYNYVTDFVRAVEIDNSFEYSVLGWIQTNNATGASFQVILQGNRNGGEIDTWETDPLTADNPYTPVFVDMPGIPANGHFMNIRCNNTQPGGQTVTAWYDDVALIEWSPWQVVSDEGSIEVPYPNGYRYAQIKVPAWVDWPEDDVTLIDHREWPLNASN
ncbi:CapA family protein [bacterium]|nr:CapA family protein [bacterium]